MVGPGPLSGMDIGWDLWVGIGKVWACGVGIGKAVGGDRIGACA